MTRKVQAGRKATNIVSREARRSGSLYGLYIGDALAMPVHWYYDRHALRRDYGIVRDYLTPKSPHPDSILWRSAYKPMNEKGEILHDQAQYWGRRGIHYHQFLKAGENTLNLKLCNLLIESLNEIGRYDPDDYLDRYVAYMTTPGSHKDTYIEEYHRHFFTNYASGVPLRQCGVPEKHIGGLAGVVPLILFYQDDFSEARRAALEHLSLTHLGPRMEASALFLAETLFGILRGDGLKETILRVLEKHGNPLLSHPYLDWMLLADETVIGKRFSTACYVEDSVPAVIFLALKYHGKAEDGLIANANLGGDNAYRGAVLGALLGAENGIEAFPERWIEGLVDPPPALRS
jgi:ADP-ribosylglycohydrolase